MWSSTSRSRRTGGSLGFQGPRARRRALAAAEPSRNRSPSGVEMRRRRAGIGPESRPISRLWQPRRQFGSTATTPAKRQGKDDAPKKRNLRLAARPSQELRAREGVMCRRSRPSRSGSRGADGGPMLLGDAGSTGGGALETRLRAGDDEHHREPTSAFSGSCNCGARAGVAGRRQPLGAA